jgi:hypothetical protein
MDNSQDERERRLADRAQWIGASSEERQRLHDALFKRVRGPAAAAELPTANFPAEEWYGATVHDQPGGLSARDEIARRRSELLKPATHKPKHVPPEVIYQWMEVRAQEAKAVGRTFLEKEAVAACRKPESEGGLGCRAKDARKAWRRLPFPELRRGPGRPKG